MSLFDAAMRLCDDCGREAADLAWFGPNIRVCGACRASRERDGRWPIGIASRAAETRRAALDTLMQLGRPQGLIPAYFDMHPDDIVFWDSKMPVTAGDIRELQAFLREHGVEPKDRLTQLIQKLPAGAPQ